MIRCEIGVGERKVILDSIGVDIRKTPAVDIIADACHLPFKSSRFDYVFSSHVIEHFSHKEIESVLREWIRILKVGGTLEVRCPDLRARAFLFFLMPSNQNIQNIYGKQDYPANYHKCGFSFKILKNMLEANGIGKVSRIFDGYRGIPFLPRDLHIRGVKIQKK